VRRLGRIGSTSAPGTAAKPMIDVLLLVDDVEDGAALVAPLEAAGFELRVSFDDRTRYATVTRHLAQRQWTS